MRYAFVDAHAGEFSVKRMCRLLKVSRSGYYAWRHRSPSQREQVNQALLEQIKLVYLLSNRTYGSPRIYKHLRGEGLSFNRKRIARLMQSHQIVAKKASGRSPVTTKQRVGAKAAPNVLSQEFAAQGPNQKWGVDITYIETAEGWLYLAVVLDLYSRRVVGWAMSDRANTCLVNQALKMALLTRQPGEGLLHHSDRGCQYTSDVYLEQLRQHDCQISMSRSGNCYDNAMVESFFATLKTECAHTPFKSRAHARTSIFEYIEGWYNRQRLHSSLGYMSPMMFEQVLPH